MFSRLRLGWLAFWGRVMNLAGFPGFVRECDYASQLGVTVKVRKSALYTTVTVNGVDVFFYRLTGGIDGVGFSRPTSDCKLVEALPSKHFRAGPDTPHLPTQTETSSHRAP